MQGIDATQDKLIPYLKETNIIMNELLSRTPFNGSARIICNLDLGFPHDVIRIAGGFATGIYVSWDTYVPFIPIDICMNACTVSIYKLDRIKADFFNEKRITDVLGNLTNSSYIANFHRGNHFVSYVESNIDSSRYIMIHSSAAEFETLYNGLYPVEGNYFYSKIKTYYSKNRYIRYLEGKTAELYWRIANNLYNYNQNRHDFIVNCIVNNDAEIIDGKHYHHYGMPSHCEAIVGCHLLEKNSESPLLSRPGEKIYLLKYHKRIDGDSVNDKIFTTPHGVGKRHFGTPSISISGNKFCLDENEYFIKYGESLRAHPNLLLRDIAMHEYINQLKKQYDFSIVDEYEQLVSLNKFGIRIWSNYEK